MNLVKKIVSICILSSFFSASAFAVWWNPFTWFSSTDNVQVDQPMDDSVNQPAVQDAVPVEQPAMDKQDMMMDDSAPPSDNMPSDAPAADMPSDAPAADMPSDAPAADMPSDAPAADMPSDAPAADMPSDVPTSDDVPSDASSGDNMPSDAPSGDDMPLDAPSGDDMPADAPTGDDMPSDVPTADLPTNDASDQMLADEPPLEDIRVRAADGQDDDSIIE